MVVRFYKDYDVGEYGDIDEAISKAEQMMSDEIDSGWFFPLDTEVVDN